MNAIFMEIAKRGFSLYNCSVSYYKPRNNLYVNLGLYPYAHAILIPKKDLLQASEIYIEYEPNTRNQVPVPMHAPLKETDAMAQPAKEFNFFAEDPSTVKGMQFLTEDMPKPLWDFAQQDVSTRRHSLVSSASTNHSIFDNLLDFQNLPNLPDFYKAPAVNKHVPIFGGGFNTNAYTGSNMDAKDVIKVMKVERRKTK